MNVVMIIPTGVGAAIGGHAGDAGAVAKLLASCCDTLVTHPNVLNASDINEMTENMLYVDGYNLDRFLNANINLARSRQNRILLVVNKPASIHTINSVRAAKYTIGADVQLVELDTPLEITANKLPNGAASGIVTGVDELCEQVGNYEFDVLGIQSLIEVESSVAIKYLRDGKGVNPWGGAEALVSRQIAHKLGCPVAHAPLDSEVFKDFHEVVHPRLAAELVSVSYIHCILRGLHDCPLPVGTLDRDSLRIDQVDAMVIPAGLWSTPHHACLERGIPIIEVQENTVVAKEIVEHKRIKVANYLEAAGVLMAMQAGVTRESVSA